MNQCWSAEAPSQETTNTEGTTKLSRAKDDSSNSQQAKTFLAMRRKVKDLGFDDNGKIRSMTDLYGAIRDPLAS
jgi:hypothetical protein